MGFPNGDYIKQVLIGVYGLGNRGAYFVEQKGSISYNICITWGIYWWNKLGNRDNEQVDPSHPWYIRSSSNKQ